MHFQQRWNSISKRIRTRTWWQQRVGGRPREFRDVESCHPEVPVLRARAAVAVNFLHPQVVGEMSPDYGTVDLCRLRDFVYVLSVLIIDGNRCLQDVDISGL